MSAAAGMGWLVAVGTLPCCRDDLFSHMVAHLYTSVHSVPYTFCKSASVDIFTAHAVDLAWA